jgi:hypothetical protein
MNKSVMAAIFALGLAVVAWVGWGFVGTSPLALAMTVVIAAVYVLGTLELLQFRQGTAALMTALRDGAQQPVAELGPWLDRLPAPLRHPVRQRIEGARAVLPGPALTPYLVGLLVMLGMLGTFLGMVVTFKGAVLALETSTSLESIRAALAEPIKGLGLSFGTSVAGVAASAMLGLMAAISRRERLAAVRQLDASIPVAFRPFSASHRRDEGFQALQALPLIAERLQGLVDGVEQRHGQLAEQLLAQQQGFHREAAAAYTQLASTVGASLHDSLGASARVAGDTLRPVVEQAMAQLAQESQRAHQRLSDATAVQMQALSAQWEGTARQVSTTWEAALQSHRDTQGQLVAGLEGALQSVTQSFEQRSSALQAAWQDTVAQSNAAQQAADAQRLAGWSQSMDGMAQTLAAQWERVGARTVERQQGVCDALEAAVTGLTSRMSEQVAQTLAGTARVMDQSDALLRTRTESEAQWLQAQGDRMDTLAGVWRTELAALRDAEAERGRAAVDRLETLQAAVAQHLAALGTALEAPLTRLLQTASDVPQAAAQVIAQLRQEMTQLSERDNLALAERTAMLEQLGSLLHSVKDAAVQQRGAIESLVDSAASVLEQSGARFAQALEVQAGKAGDVATQVAASAVELSSLGEAFGHGVELFTASNDKLADSLQRMEGAIGQSLARSDEQLAYYVAQAREVIDLSIASQQGIVQDLRRLHGQSAAAQEAAA